MCFSKLSRKLGYEASERWYVEDVIFMGRCEKQYEVQHLKWVIEITWKRHGHSDSEVKRK